MLSVVDIIRLILHSLRAGLTDKTLCSALFIAAFVHFQLLTPTYSLGGNQTIEDAQINASAIVSPDPKSIAWVHS